MKNFGFYIWKKTTVSPHVKGIITRIRRKYWTLRHLKKLGFTKEELVVVYKANIRPIADYCDVVYHSMLSDAKDKALERAQVGALQTIFDYKMSSRKLRQATAVSTLRERCVLHCDNFANKCVSSSKFSHWFPLNNDTRQTRKTEKNIEKYARCDRLNKFTSLLHEETA